jgi:SAM-dependent methyltransferase
MQGLEKKQDALGTVFQAAFRGRHEAILIDRDDGYIDFDYSPAYYFAPFRKWPARQRQAIRLARGRVLDIGCGAGRVALYLQDKGLRVTAIDNSPLAVNVCRRRGIKDARVLPIEQISPHLGLFDTIIMYGNNFGLVGSFNKARRLLRRMHRMTAPDARILAETNDPYATSNPDHLTYHRRNRRRGRMPGQLRFRVRYRSLATPWMDYLMVSLAEMRKIIAGTGWRLKRCFRSGGSVYVVALEKEQLGRGSGV